VLVELTFLLKRMNAPPVVLNSSNDACQYS
jgi:hypothetical protein